jgi:hypothetical protein
MAAVEVTLHWYAGTRNTPAGRHLRDAYFYRDPTSGKGYGGLVDAGIPAVILGVALGTFGASWPPRRLAFGAIILSVGIVALFPWYWSFFQEQHVWLLPRWKTGPLAVGDFVVAYVEALAICGVFTYGAKLLTHYFWDSGGSGV